MPPVPVHIDDPIVPPKAQGATQPAPEPPTKPSVNATTTTTQHAPSSYPAARPGAVAAPAPTGYIPRPPPEPTRTQQQVMQDLPPPPQPGAVPVPSLYQQASTASTNTLPPPPKAGEAMQQRQVAQPSQMNIPAPTQNYAPTHSTTTNIPVSTGQQPHGPTTLNLGPVPQVAPYEHPQGYQQNSYAQDLSPTQRSSLGAQEQREGIVGNLSGETAGETAENVWNAVKNLASVAGEKLVETEESVWKRINGQ